MHVELDALIEQIRNERLNFVDVLAVVHRHYECSPGEFITGAGTPRETRNAAGANAASCCLLAFARRLGLDEPTTLALYAEHYRAVLTDPDGRAHANIRAFMTNGWAGVHLPEAVLRLRGPG